MIYEGRNAPCWVQFGSDTQHGGASRYLGKPAAAEVGRLKKTSTLKLGIVVKRRDHKLGAERAACFGGIHRPLFKNDATVTSQPAKPVGEASRYLLPNTTK